MPPRVWRPFCEAFVRAARGIATGVRQVLHLDVLGEARRPA